MSRSSSRSSVRKLWQAATDLQSGMSPQGLYWLLRGSLVGRSREPGGFLLPTVTLMLLVLSLVVGTLVFRTFNRTAEVIGQRQQRALYNAATPAIDRAKLKLEYLFTEAALPTPPSDADLIEELAKSTYDLKAQGMVEQDEVRLDLNGDGVVDNAWRYLTDVDGDGDQELVAYSILTQANYVEKDADGNITNTISLDSNDEDKAQALVVRNGPINLQDRGSDCSNVAASPYAAWESVTSSDLRKAIQVHAVVLDLNDAQDGVDNAVTATLEMQQDRQSDLGNRWGAWFRYDLELHPGFAFYWNGAMHTEGSFLMYNNPVLHLVSSPESCIYNRSASEISMATWDPDKDGEIDFQGQFLIGKVEGDNNPATGQTAIVDAYVPAPGQSGGTDNRIVISKNGTTQAVNPEIEDSVGDKFGNDDKDKPSEIVMNPITLFTQDISAARFGDTSNTDARDEAKNPDWFGDPLPKPLDDSLGTYNQRLFNTSTDIPFLDDTYRADNRYGPTASYGRASAESDCGKQDCVDLAIMGTSIPNTNLDLVEPNPLGLAQPNETDYGYDGYWERRARRTGVRIIVGQRLELGNANEWLYETTDTNGNGLIDIDPLYPPPANAYSDTNMEDQDRANEMRQWRTLRDNLAAAQATAVYHYRSDSANDEYDYPVACFATTVHPGTEQTDLSSRTFTYIDTDNDTNSDTLQTDFYAGQGTNGIEFAPPFAGNATNFETEVEDPDSPLRIALTNLAYFAGDPDGAFPPLQESNGGNVHPYPALTMWGNFSELRRVIRSLDAGGDYNDFSPADKTTLHTATCTIGMLAYATDVKKSVFDSTVDSLSVSGLTDFVVAVQTLLNGKLGKYNSNSGTPFSNDSEIWQVVSANDNYDAVAGTVTCDSDVNNVVLVDLEDGNIDVAGNDLFVDFPQGQTTSTYDPKAWTSDDFKDYMGQYNLGHWMCAQFRTEKGNAYTQAEVDAEFSKIASLITNIELSIFQLERDRALGFREGSFDFATSDPDDADTIPWDPVTGEVTYGGIGSASTTVVLPTGCNPTSVNKLISGQGQGSTDPAIAMALAVCSTSLPQTFPIRYPSTYYLFPVAAHSHDGYFPPATVGLDGAAAGSNSVETNAGTANIPEAIQSEVTSLVRDGEYTKDSYIYNAGGTGVNYYRDNSTTDRFFYRPVEDGIGTIAGSALGNGDGVVQSASEDLSEFVAYLGVQPRNYAAPTTTPTGWSTPIDETGSGANEIFIDTNDDGSADDTWSPAFLDVGIFNGREQMSTRVLSIDLDLMRQRQVGEGGDATTFCSAVDPVSDTTDNNGLCWLPLPTLMEESGGVTSTGALIYAFREDAVREDAIARPTRADASGLSCTDWTNIWDDYLPVVTTDTDSDGIVDTYDHEDQNTASTLDSTDMVMNATGSTQMDTTAAFYDPPISPCTGVSPKPVDFYADPDRRPHGFALRNGQDLRRQTASGFDEYHRPFTFVTDNLAYIWGNFNLHSTDNGSTQNLQEFETPLTTDFDSNGTPTANHWSNFYTRNDLENRFAAPASDSWRVAEIVADGVTALSQDFEPGYIAQGLMWNSSSSDNSYGGMHVLRTSTGLANDDTTYSGKWVLENGSLSGTDPALLTSPIKISREGLPSYGTTPTMFGTLANQLIETPQQDADGKAKVERITAPNSDLTINGLIISGINPSRLYHDYGGMHNFIRLIENWGSDRSLNFSGSLIQLSFSKYSAPYFMTDRETGSVVQDDTDSDASIGYYVAANRNFGYDVALMYAPAGSVAGRLSAPSNDRSEFYRELAIDDPYIENLLCAQYDNNGVTTRIDPRLTDTDCPAP